MIFKEFAMRFARHIKPYWWQSSIVFAFMVLATTSSLAFPYILMILIDEALPDEDYYLLGLLLATLFGIIALNIISAFIANYLYRWVGNRVVFEMRSELFSHLLRLPLSFFKRNKTGDIAHRLNNDVQIVQKTLTSSVLKLVNSVLTLVSLGAVLIWLDAPLFLGLSLLVPCFIVNLKYFQPKIGKVAEATQHKTSDILGFFIERFDNIKLVQSYNTYRYESDKLGRRQGELFDLEMSSTALSLSAGSISSFIMSLAPVVILGWGGHQVMQGVIGLGALIAFFQYFMRIFGPLESLNQLYIDCVRASVSLRRIVEFMDVPAEMDAEPERTKPFSFKNKIAFKDVEFAYNGNPVLRSFDLELEKGKTYALVGASGCGKSTVVDLLCRFYQPQKGEIAIDDASCKAFGLGQYRDCIGLVSQEAQLFRDSVLENIRYGRLDSSKEDVERAAAELEINGADLHAPEDSLAMVCDSKANLSGGQKQRIALARAVLKNPEIIVLDEATSALDSESEEKLLCRLKSQADAKTLIIVSHRLSAVREVDEIICMDEGKIVEKGTHAELIKKKGHYWELFKTQIANS